MFCRWSLPLRLKAIHLPKSALLRAAYLLFPAWYQQTVTRHPYSGHSLLPSSAPLHSDQKSPPCCSTNKLGIHPHSLPWFQSFILIELPLLLGRDRLLARYFQRITQSVRDSLLFRALLGGNHVLRLQQDQVICLVPRLHQKHP